MVMPSRKRSLPLVCIFVGLMASGAGAVGRSGLAGRFS